MKTLENARKTQGKSGENLEKTQRQTGEKRAFSLGFPKFSPGENPSMSSV
jgi:hypothetical protein